MRAKKRLSSRIICRIHVLHFPRRMRISSLFVRTLQFNSCLFLGQSFSISFIFSFYGQYIPPIYTRGFICRDINVLNAKEARACDNIEIGLRPYRTTITDLRMSNISRRIAIRARTISLVEAKPRFMLRGFDSAIWRDSQIHRIRHQREFSSIEVTGTPLIGVINERHLSRRIYRRRS